MLTRAQRETYANEGYVVLPDVLTPAEVAELHRAIDGLVAGARKTSASDAVYDHEDGHSPAAPKVRRLKEPHRHHPAFARLVRHPLVVEVLKQLWPSGVRFDASKLNMKSADFGAAVEWHQDWAFYPHTNDDLAAVGFMIDDFTSDNGPMMVIPGSHRGPVYDHHVDGVFCGAIDPLRAGLDFDRAVPLLGRAGSVTVHHVRLVHGSAANRSQGPRRYLLHQYRAADAWPLRGVKDYAEYESQLIAGTPNAAPRLEPVPVRMPFPKASRENTIYEDQRMLKHRYFEDAKSRVR
jgi:ectoine hydroxylase-related dioxygenase (phytanoyl-CoA dioxygenase family)